MATFPQSEKQRLWWRWLPLLLWCGAIFLLSHQPRAALPRVDAHVDYEPGDVDSWLGNLGIDRDVILKKGSHLLAYGLLALLAFWACENLHQAFWLALLYAILDEMHQGLIPERTARLADVLLDGMGAASILLLLWRYRRRRGE